MRSLTAGLVLILSSVLSTEAHAQRASSQDIPADAYGIFENTNNPTFLKVLLVETKQVSLTLTITLRGRRMANPLTCRSQVLGRITPNMQLILTCKGERVPYKLTYRAPSQSWVVTEEASTPEVYQRRR